MALPVAQAKCRYGDFTYLRHDLYIGASLRLYGEYCQEETELVLSLIGPGQVVLEAGANIGAVTVPMAQAVGPGGLVVALEPQRLVHQILCANIVQNRLDNVVALHAAAGRTQGSVTVPAYDYGRSNNFGGIEMNSGEGASVPMTTIDDLRLPALSLLKADVEGMEAEVLGGATRTIERHRPILFVENDRAEKSDALIALIRGFGYRLWRHAAPLYNPSNWNGNPHNIFGATTAYNMLCVPHERPFAPAWPEIE